MNGTTTLTFTITNPNSTLSLTGVGFTDTFPAGLEVTATPGTSSSCGGTFAPNAGDTTLTFSGGTIAASGTCTVVVNVTGTSAGVKNNTSGAVTSNEGGTGNTASTSITVVHLTAGPSLTIPATKGTSTGTVVVGTFTDTNPTAPIGTFTAVTINWGDGSSTTSGTITQTGGVGTAFQVIGSHTYASNGTFTLGISVTGDGGAPLTGTVEVATFNYFSVSAPSAVTTWNSFTFTVTALTRNGTVNTGYSGTVVLTSSDGSAMLPANSTLTAGKGTFTATLQTAGTQTITATDSVHPTFRGTSNAIAVEDPYFSVTAPSSATAGNQFSFTVTALNANGTVDSVYSGTVHFTSSDGSATLPVNSTLNSGKGTFPPALETPGSQTITATGTVHSAITGTSGQIAPGRESLLLCECAHERQARDSVYVHGDRAQPERDR